MFIVKLKHFVSFTLIYFKGIVYPKNLLHGMGVCDWIGSCVEMCVLEGVSCQNRVGIWGVFL